MSFRNIAIIAHVDHGKTTLVDALLKQSGTFGEHEEIETCVMDSNDQEKERGITIYAKNTAVNYKWEKINIVDTPGHADFWSEVERVLRMVDSVLLLVDAYEWPMPQTKFVLKKSLELWLKPIVVINKIDKPTARPEKVVDMVFDLFIKLNATDEQLDFPVIYAAAKKWIALKNLNDPEENIIPLFEAIINNVKVAQNDLNKEFRMQIANLGYDNYLWRLGIWRVYEWKVKSWEQVTIIWNDWVRRTWKITKVFTTLWLQKISVEEALAGDIITIAWIPDIYVWETISTNPNSEPLPAITIDEPTLKMEFLVNDSPFAWREWKLVTSRNIRERLERELEMNVWLKIDFTWEDNIFIVSGRWELHLWVLVETMRREWYELQVGCPHVILKEEDWVKFEPIEYVIIIVPEEFSWWTIEKLSKRKWILKDLKTQNTITTLEFEVPTRGLLWFRGIFTIDTKWEWIIYSSFSHYEKHKWTIEKRDIGSMISGFSGKTMAYSLWKLQERWPILVEPNTEVYEWMIIWEHLKWWDLTVNPTKNKQLTNIRASGTDEAIKLTPIRRMTLEDALDYIKEDEYVEVTPKNIRLRKKLLSENSRKKSWNI